MERAVQHYNYGVEQQDLENDDNPPNEPLGEDPVVIHVIQDDNNADNIPIDFALPDILEDIDAIDVIQEDNIDDDIDIDFARTLTPDILKYVDDIEVIEEDNNADDNRIDIALPLPPDIPEDPDAIEVIQYDNNADDIRIDIARPITPDILEDEDAIQVIQDDNNADNIRIDFALPDILEDEDAIEVIQEDNIDDDIDIDFARPLTPDILEDEVAIQVIQDDNNADDIRIGFALPDILDDEAAIQVIQDDNNGHDISIDFALAGVLVLSVLGAIILDGMSLFGVIPSPEGRDRCYDVERDPIIENAARVDTCGVKKNLDHVHSGGLEEFPWMSRLLVTGNSNFSCGGSIIHEQYILTAAHCCLNVSVYPDQYQMVVRIGQYDTHSNQDCDNPGCAAKYSDLNVKKVILKYDNLTPNNICLVKLDTKIKFSDDVSPICLPTDCGSMQLNSFDDDTMTTLGWGPRSAGKEEQKSILQKVSVRTVPIDTCLDNKDDSYICACAKMGHKVCAQDSGGPLMFESSITGQHYVVGVTYIDADCSNTCINSLFISTRVAPYLGWILTNITSPE